MALSAKIFNAKVMHKRFFPKENAFNYNVYYLVLPLADIKSLNELKLNRFGLISFYEKDHGKKDGSSILSWLNSILLERNINIANMQAMLVTLPRVLGYAFNPVSFYLCFDSNNKLKAVVSEVNNTFGETHNYICAKKDNEEINPIDILEAEKVFHVSPFLKREGKYQFRFDYREDKLGIWIDYFDAEGKKELITSLIGNFSELTKSNLKKAFWKHPLVTFKTITLIHYQAFKLIFKKVKYIVKPVQKGVKVTTSTNLTKS